MYLYVVPPELHPGASSFDHPNVWACSPAAPPRPPRRVPDINPRGWLVQDSLAHDSLTSVFKSTQASPSRASIARRGVKTRLIDK
ncbi:uncharacterized protein N7496_010055 [Penicillium cataractarum]|uniref:Uncharacterized protein n=1 Tax=Penicillium cataractarum TaxID=2100454 RepID=A0A9W9RQ47_9EURO|nr:uncharacterized protein N7496_010055 [Penicillium cataractarum]KAJ5364342.1 hypothetical protein N7496_010055 [Penicillium cataractarum]